MEVSATLRYLRMSPRKVRLAADLVRGKNIVAAQNVLNFADKKAAEVVSKLLTQAIANAKNNFKLDESDLYVSKIMVDEGPKLKRFRPRARGQAYEIQKKTSHITLVLDSVGGRVAKKKKVAKVKDEVKEGEVVSTSDEKTPKAEKPKFKVEKEMPKPVTGKVSKRIFQRKTY